MAIYHTNEASLELPGDWDDSTLHILGATDAQGVRYGLTMTREKAQPNEDLAAYVTRQAKEQSQALRGYEALGKRSATVDGLPAVELKFRWMGTEELVFQHQAFVAHRGLMLSYTASAPARFAEKAEVLMSEVLNTIRFRSR